MNLGGAPFLGAGSGAGVTAQFGDPYRVSGTDYALAAPLQNVSSTATRSQTTLLWSRS